MRLGGGNWCAGGEEISTFGEHLDDVGDADLAEGLDGFDDAELEMQALISRPFHAAFGLGEDVDSGKDAVRRIFLSGGEQCGPEVGRDALAVGSGIEFGN